MGLLSLLEVSSMPMIQVLLLCLLGAFMATQYLNLLPLHARNSLNKIVFAVFTPCLVFASLAKTVRLEDIISWWFMPVNIGLTFLVGGTLGWIAVKILRPLPHLQPLIIAMCSTAMCKEDGNPFGDKNVCSTKGLSYVSFSMALGSFYIWTYTYHLIKSAGAIYREMVAAAEEENSKEPNKDLEANEKTLLLNGSNAIEDVSWLRNLIIGDNAPLRVIDDSIVLLGDATIPCITLILGGNLTQGLRKARLGSLTVIAVICVRYIILPVVGIGVVKAASHLGFLPSDPLYHFVLMIQFTLPPAMNIGTMTQLFDVAQEECSVLFLWTYLVSAVALTGWSTVFMWILS
ncbi:hypothetical protein DH2020_038668 [Rehmannia glutinosa]|uniref:Uncharacterized protein n=1 Tax=Rehmannia glutinosa TaxID=99300 RepID=A0ABR0UY66_REHGL